MSFLHALILGLVQGLTEFFPISSSGHLRMAKWFLGLPSGEEFLYFDLICHSGTLLALVVYLRKEIWAALHNVKEIALFTLALTPLVPAYFLLKPLRLAFSKPEHLGFSLMATSVLLFAASIKKKYHFEGVKWKNVLCIGLMQTLALIPGISRSGATIAAGRLCGWRWQEAAQFSFLLSVPTILGGQILETLKTSETGHVDASCYAVGFCTSAIAGWISVRCVFWAYKNEKVSPFAWYCLAAGLTARAIFHG